LWITQFFEDSIFSCRTLTNLFCNIFKNLI
jgi:hypothetical protein